MPELNVKDVLDTAIKWLKAGKVEQTHNLLVNCRQRLDVEEAAEDLKLSTAQEK